MATRWLSLIVISISFALPGAAQSVDSGRESVARGNVAGWRTPSIVGQNSGSAIGPVQRTSNRQANDSAGTGNPTTAQGSNSNITPIASQRAPQRARVTSGSGTLPNDHGQVWREYDITPYTSRVSTTKRPEQAVVDWVLRETGYEAWHGEPLGVLSASPTALRVYHTPEMHTLVADIVDRFVNSQAETHAFGLRIVTVGSPNWRARALRLMKPIPVQSAGVQGWLLAKEDAALLISELRRRSDFREHNSPNLLVHNGQATVISTMRQRTYPKGIIATANMWPGFQPETGMLNEGFSLEFSPLVGLDGISVDAIVKLRLHQIEKMVPVMLDVSNPTAPNQQHAIEVPQMTMVHLHERFRWPVDQVMLLSMGVVATPAPTKGNIITEAIPMLKTPPRADALLFVESKGRVQMAPATGEAAASTARTQPTYHNRY